MRHKAELLAALSIFFITSAFQTRTPVPLKTTGNVTLSSNEDVRATFEAVASRAGIRAIFARNFQAGAPVPFRAENMNVTDALDLLSKLTGTFWVPWDSGVILVAADTQQNRRDYDRQFVAVIPMPRGTSEEDAKKLIASMKTLTAVGNKFVVRDSSSGIDEAKKIIAGLDASNPNIDAMLLPSTVDAFLAAANSGSRSTPSKRSQLRIPSLSPVSLSVNETNREIYERLARMAGLNIAFHRAYPRRTSAFQAENMDFFDALDLLSVRTGSFWQPINENTVLVVEDTQQNRRDLELSPLEIIYLSEGTTAQRLAEIVNALRTVLGLRGIYQYEPRNAILLRDTPSNMLLAEDLISALEGTPTLSKAVVADLSSGFSQLGFSFRAAATTRALLKLRVAGTLPFNESTDTRTLYESVAQAAGISVVFGPKFTARPVDFHFENVDTIEALDLLALQSGTFWQPLDERSIVVMDDTQQNRRDYEIHLVKTILLPVKTTTGDLNSLLNILRVSLSLRGIYNSAAAKAIVLHDTPSRVALVEQIIRQLIPNPDSMVVMTVPAPGFAETRDFRNAPVARSQLEFKPSGPISMQLNQDGRVSYQTLAEVGGIKINFDPRFNPGAPMPLRLQGMDIPDALDQLSLQTGNYWIVLDPRTVLVAPDTSEIRRQFDPLVSRTVFLRNFTQGAAGEIVNILRTALSMRQVESNGASTIAMQDTPQRIAVAEQIIANLDRP